MKGVHLYPYNPASESCKLLAQALGIKRISHRNTTYKGDPDKIIINWGATKLPDEIVKSRVINEARAVDTACNKVKYFEALRDSGITPWFTTSKEEAVILVEDGNTIVERHAINGMGGAGIRIVDDVNDLSDAPLYVAYIPKKQEYRVHVIGGLAVDVQRKVRNREVPDEQIDWRVRNLAGGFVFARNEALGDVPGAVRVIAVTAVRATGLTFGAVDVIYNERYDRAYALEVNTAPGLMGETVEKYAEALRSLVERIRG